MFDKFKQLAQLKGLQDALKKEKFTVEKEGIKIVMNGNFLIEEIILDDNSQKDPDTLKDRDSDRERRRKQEAILKDCFNELVQKIQFSMAQRFSGLV